MGTQVMQSRARQTTRRKDKLEEKATEKITIRKGAELNGDLSTKTIVIEEGAQFNGQLTMGEAVKPGSQGSLDSSGSRVEASEVNPTSHEVKVH